METGKSKSNTFLCHLWWQVCFIWFDFIWLDLTWFDLIWLIWFFFFFFVLFCLFLIKNVYHWKQRRMHLWELKRVYVPSRSFDDHEDDVASLLWKNSEVVWSCSKNGTFIQSKLSTGFYLLFYLLFLILFDLWWQIEVKYEKSFPTRKYV